MTETDPNDLAARLADLEREQRESRAIAERQALRAELQLTDDKQVAAIHDIKKGTSLSAKEALAAASTRDPALFAQANPAGYIPGQHASLRPTLGGGPPAPPTVKEQAKAIAAHRLVNPMETDALEKRLHGELLRKALVDGGAPGWAGSKPLI